MSKKISIGLGVLLVVLVAFNWTSLLPTRLYFKTIFNLALPQGATNIARFRFGPSTPRVEFDLPKEDFPEFKRLAVKNGCVPWRTQTYDAKEGTTVLQMVTIAGFGEGTTGRMEICRNVRSVGSFTFVYDYNTERFIAIKLSN